jgi:hypothetical protein
MALLVWFQELGQLLKREERRAWWAGHGRDLLNAAGLAALSLSLWAAGFSGPMALLAGALETLAVFGLYTFATWAGLRHPRAWAIAAGALVCLPALAWPGRVALLLGHLTTRLFG